MAIIAVVAAKPVDVDEEPAPFVSTDSRDVDGSYSFTYTAEDSSKTEVRQPDGTIVGGYQYIDADGVLQVSVQVAIVAKHILKLMLLLTESPVPSWC